MMQDRTGAQKMLRTMVSVDDSLPAAFRFVAEPKVGHTIGVWTGEARAHATITGFRRERGPDGCFLVVCARSH